MTYTPPFASAEALSPVVVRIGDTLPVVVIQFLDGEGDPQDASAWGATLELYSAMGIPTTLTGVWDAAGSAWYFPWPDPFVDPAEYRSEVAITDGTTTIHYAAPRVLAYDPAELWADPHVVIDMAGGTATYSEAVAAIWLATEAVRAWATRPVPSPVPDVVRWAVAILAARALTTPVVSGGDDAPAIISERIGDYSVRYAEPSFGAQFIVGDVAEMLKFLRPSQYDTYIGPHVASVVPGSLPASTTDELWVFDEDEEI